MGDRSKQSHQIRIIAGQWRGRKLTVIDQPGLRPTPDRIRETLFNWLAPKIVGANCLDCFAGTGALGFEAVSRGAGSVVMVEQNFQAYQQLLQNCELLKTSAAELFNADIFSLLPTLKRQFDIVFIDPPFNHNLVAPTLQALWDHNCLSPSAWVYIEAEQAIQDLIPTPQPWKILKQKKAGQVHYHLLT